MLTYLQSYTEGMFSFINSFFLCDIHQIYYLIKINGKQIDIDRNIFLSN